MGVVRRAAGRFGAVRVGAAPTCALIANGLRDEKKDDRATPRGGQRGTHVFENWLHLFT
jgi:hypothetical protein